ncbi:MAG: hypothetical protein JW816_02245 [Candidatus Buchananbacteria bacterium]|nr:hypothetical protein [Candidatus Buchananbacteria bacterium]
MDCQFAGHLENQDEVYHRHRRHIHRGMTDRLIVEGLSKINTIQIGISVHEVDFGRMIGRNIRMETDLDGGKDEIIYAARLDNSGKPRRGLTRFVKNRRAETTSIATFVILNKDGKNVLLTAFIGSRAEPEPWDEQANQSSTEFWQRHALVFGHEPIDQKTITTTCPWQTGVLT